MEHELRRMYQQFLGKAASIEEALITHLPAMAALSTRADIKEAIGDHLEETRQQKQRLDELRDQTTAADDAGFRLMLEEARALAESITDTEARDQLILASGQAVEHHEIAVYTALTTWAQRLKEDDAYGLLSMTLTEEETALSNLEAMASESGLGAAIDAIADKLT